MAQATSGYDATIGSVSFGPRDSGNTWIVVAALAAVVLVVVLLVKEKR